MTHPRICISILNWNNFDDTKKCIDSLSKISSTNYEIIILDNGSTDKSIDDLLNLQNITLIKSPNNLGFAGGHNLVINEAKSRDFDYVWLLNNDAIVTPDCLEKLIKLAESDANIGMVSPIIKDRLPPHSMQHVLTLLNSTNTGVIEVTEIDEAIRLQKLNADKVILWGTALLIKISTFRTVGLLDEKLFAYSEDTDYSMRCINNNLANKVEFEATIFHHKPDGPRKSHYFYYTNRNSFLTWKKYVGLYDLVKLTRWNLKLANKQISALNNNHTCIESIKLGIWHGLINRGGEYNRNLRISIFGLLVINTLLRIA